MSDFTPRPAQSNILAYTSGRMGVSAVPGSGKTWTLSLLAARLIGNHYLDYDQEVLIVTLVNAAVENFAARINHFTHQYGLMPRTGYRVRTLHGLAHDIVRERPGLVGLAEDFVIIDESEAFDLLNQVVHTWLKTHPEFEDAYLQADLGENQRARVRTRQLPELARDIAVAFIRTAKDRQLTPDALRHHLDALPLPLPLAEMGWEMYSDYQRALQYRGAVDFDDLIRLALLALQSDEDYLARLRSRWPYILEDEAQDSSRLQEQILRLLCGPQGNWVRVGDPNQAIYETFTTANPRFLRAFLDEPMVSKQELPNSGRSMQSIIDLANHLIDWTQRAHPVPQVRDALAPPYIRPTPEGDPQPNPPDDPDDVKIVLRPFSPQEEINAVADSLERWLPSHPDWTVAVLTPTNNYGFQMVEALKKRHIPYVDDMLRSTSETRATAGALGNLLKYLARPDSASALARLYTVWRREARQDEAAWARVQAQARLIRTCPRIEDYLWPAQNGDYLDTSGLRERDPEACAMLEAFRQHVRRWQQAVQLPIDQLLLTAAQDLFTTPSQLALTYKLAALLRQARDMHPDWSLGEMTNELGTIARNERRFMGLSQEESGFNPDAYPGKVVVSTVHKAKGLEWDRVYLVSVSNYDYPAAREGESYRSEPWYVRQNLNLPAEAIEQLRILLEGQMEEWYEEGRATMQARLELVRERLRLLYVGITRARRSLIITWNTGKRKGHSNQPAEALLALADYWTTRH